MIIRKYNRESLRNRASSLAGILLVFTVVFSSCWPVRGDSTNELLSFFVVKAEKFEGGKFIDTTNFPKLGFVAEKPDLLITNLVQMWRTRDSGVAAMVDEKGNYKAVSNQVHPSLTLKLTIKDAARFKELTEKATGNRLMVKLGDKILIAPRVVAPIEAGVFSVSSPTESELKTTELSLRKLVQ